MSGLIENAVAIVIYIPKELDTRVRLYQFHVLSCDRAHPFCQLLFRGIFINVQFVSLTLELVQEKLFNLLNLTGSTDEIPHFWLTIRTQVIILVVSNDPTNHMCRFKDFVVARVDHF